MSKNTIYIGNLNYKTTESDLYAVFRKYGKVGKIDLVTDPVTSKNKGIAFVELFGNDSHKMAIKKLDGTVMKGRTLKVSVAKERDNFKSTEKSKAPAAEKAVKVKRPKRVKGLKLLFENTKK